MRNEAWSTVPTEKNNLVTTDIDKSYLLRSAFMSDVRLVLLVNVEPLTLAFNHESKNGDDEMINKSNFKIQISMKKPLIKLQCDYLSFTLRSTFLPISLQCLILTLNNFSFQFVRYLQILFKKIIHGNLSIHTASPTIKTSTLLNSSSS